MLFRRESYLRTYKVLQLMSEGKTRLRIYAPDIKTPIYINGHGQNRIGAKTMTTKPIMGWTYDEAANRHADLDDAKTRLEKTNSKPWEAAVPFPICLTCKMVKKEGQTTNMAFVMARCKQIEEKADRQTWRGIMTQQPKTHWKKLFNPDYPWRVFVPAGGGKDADHLHSCDRNSHQGPDGKKEECAVITWQEKDKPMILNSTNAKTITKVLKSPHIDDWAGQTHRAGCGNGGSVW